MHIQSFIKSAAIEFSEATEKRAIYPEEWSNESQYKGARKGLLQSKTK